MSVNIQEWDVITYEQFASMPFDSAMLIKNFNPSTFTKPSASDILCVTRDAISHNMKPTIVNLAEGVNNIHILPKETVVVTGYENPQITFTAIGCNADFLKFVLGFASKSGNKVSPSMLANSETDFQNVALVIKCVGGGFVAVTLDNALSTGGISFTANKGQTGSFSCTIEGFGSINDPTKIPVDYYAFPAVAVQIEQREITVPVNGTYTLSAFTRPTSQTITWSSDNTDEATVAAGVVTGKAVGTVEITASVTVDGVTATDSCLVHVVSAGA